MNTCIAGIIHTMNEAIWCRPFLLTETQLVMLPVFKALPPPTAYLNTVTQTQALYIT